PTRASSRGVRENLRRRAAVARSALQGDRVGGGARVAPGVHEQAAVSPVCRRAPPEGGPFRPVQSAIELWSDRGVPKARAAVLCGAQAERAGNRNWQTDLEGNPRAA